MADHDEDYVLRWPRDLFQQEVSDLVARRRTMDNWADRCAFLLSDAFASAAPRDAFLAANTSVSQDPWSNPIPAHLGPDRGLSFMRTLLERADTLPEFSMRKPYYSQRNNAGATSTPEFPTTVREFVRVVNDLDIRGYFEQSFGKDCPDAPSNIVPGDVIAAELNSFDLWPLSPAVLGTDQTLLFDVMEVLHDLVAAPQSSRMHAWDNCGLHYGHFSTAIGRRVYRHMVNRVLSRSDLGLVLADEGEDRGRLVTVTDEARTELARAMTKRSDVGTGDDVRHAIALFRARGAGVPEKKSACIALAGVLESRRVLLKAGMLSKDEGLLFSLANSFGIRHQNGQQHDTYDPIFLDFVFWFYLAATELSDRLMARQNANPVTATLAGPAAAPPA